MQQEGERTPRCFTHSMERLENRHFLSKGSNEAEAEMIPNRGSVVRKPHQLPASLTSELEDHPQGALGPSRASRPGAGMWAPPASGRFPRLRTAHWA